MDAQSGMDNKSVNRSEGQQPTAIIDDTSSVGEVYEINSSS